MCSGGFLTYVSLAGRYEVLDDTIHLSGTMAVSPDGLSVAYYGTTAANAGCQGGHYLFYLYHADDKVREVVELSEYGLEGHAVEGISWSPDGTKLGLVTTTYQQGMPRAMEYIIVLDLAQKSVRILHQFEKYTTGSDAGSTPQWAPSGEYLAFQTFAWMPETSSLDAALWYADDTTVRRLTLEGSNIHAVGGYPAISPDERWIAVPGSEGIIIVNTYDGSTSGWEMPVPPHRVAWVRP
jgi:Tol biopolymer transport system component